MPFLPVCSFVCLVRRVISFSSAPGDNRGPYASSPHFSPVDPESNSRCRLLHSLITAAALLLVLAGGLLPAGAQTPAPLVIFPPGTQSEPITGLGEPEGVAVDGSGNLYILDYQNLALYKETLSGGTYTQSQITPSTTSFDTPWSVAVDGSGNIYVTDFGNQQGYKDVVYKFTKSGSSYIQTVIGNFVAPDGIAVDSSGNVYVADFGCMTCLPTPLNGGLYKLTLSGGSYTKTQIGSGLGIVSGVAVDGSGNVYATEFTDFDFNTYIGTYGTLYKETLSSGNYTQSVVSKSFVTPTSVAVDPAGNLYVTDDNNIVGSGLVYKETYSGGSYTQSTLINNLYSPEAVAIDQSGNLFLAVLTGTNSIGYTGAIYKQDYANPPSLSFGSVNVGLTSSAQTVTVENIGNAALEFAIPSSGDNPSIAAGFNLASGSGGECPLVTSSSSTVGSLGAGASCTLSVTSTPQATGSYSGSLVLTDNNLNQTSPYATQTITLSGTGTGTDKASYFTVTGASSITAGTQTSITVRAYDAAGNLFTGYSGTVHITSSDPSAVLPANSTLSSGVGTFNVTLKTSGSRTVTATDTTTSSVTGSVSIAVDAAAANHLAVTAPSSATAGSSFPITVLAYDAYGNFVSTYTGIVHFTSTDSAATLPANSALSSGEGTFTATLGTGGNQTITASDTSNSLIAGTSGTISVTQAPAITSANSATFIVGALRSFTATASGYPAPTLSETGALPSGVTFANGTLSGTPAAGTAGSHTIIITASNGVGSNATQSFTLDVDQPPAITSPSSTIFIAGALGSFTVTASGYPAPIFSETGVLPSGVTFANGTLSGTPAAGTVGSYTIAITASNGVGSNATQSFTLNVDQPPAITSAGSTTFITGALGSFTVTASGYPAPVFSEIGPLPSGVTFASNGTLSGAPVAGTAGTYPLTIIASNGIGSNATQSFTLVINAPPSYVVNTTADTTTGSCTAQTSTNSNTTDASCTLRAALAAAGTAGAANIYFDSANVFLAANAAAQNTITLTNGSLPIPSNTTIQGATSGSGTSLKNLVTISGGGSSSNFSIFTVAGSATGAEIRNLTIANGYTQTQGGAISNSGNLTITSCAFSNNYAAGYLGSGNGGGAIYNDGTLTVSGSTFSGNTSAPGGAISIGSGLAAISTSTFYGNTAVDSKAGGAIFINGSTTVTVQSSTFSGNSATGGGAIFNNGTLSATNSILSGNTGGDCGFNGASSCPVNGSNGNVLGGIPNLTPLGNYGGPMQTMLPLPGSSAICAGLAANIPSGVTTDQRGEPNTNTSYPGYSAGSPCVDAGAAQTNYAMSFTQQPSSGDAGVAMSPAPAVTLTESGSVFNASSVTIPLTLSGSGVLSGSSASTSAGVATYSNLFVNAAGSGDTLTANLSLDPDLTTPLSLTLTSNSFDAASAVKATQAISAAFLTENIAITSFTPITGSGGTGTLSYSVAPALPAGLNFSTSSGAVNGVPTVTSPESPYTVTVTDSLGATASASFSLEVSGPPKATTVIASKGITVNVPPPPFTPVTGSGGVGTLRYNVSPTLPPGLAMASASGAISGLPSVSTPAQTYTVTVTDANGATATATFSLAVNGPVTATAAIPSKAVTQNYAASFTPVTGGGGTTPLSYSISAILPAGLGFSSSTGAVTGTPTVTSPATNYTVTVTDANGATATAQFALTVNPGVTATATIPSESLTYNTAATFTPVTASGGTGTLSFTIAPSLPTGLSFSSTTGAIIGAPSAASSAANYTVTVTDTNGATASASFSLTVNKAAATVTLANLTQTYAGSPLSATATTTPSGLAVTITYNGSRTAPTAAGSYAVAATINDTNYEGSANGTLVISKAMPTLSWTTPTSIVYGTALGVAQLDATASVTGSFTYTPAAGTVLSAGPHTLSVSFTPADASDYSTPAAATTSITVMAAPLTVVLNNATKAYGAANPSFTGTVTGFENGDTPAIAGLAYASAAIATSPAGTYPITASITSSNYTLNATPGTLTVTGAALTVTANNATRIFGTANPAFTGTVTGQQNGDSFTENFTTSATAASPVGTYAIVPSVTGANLADYTISAANGTLTVTQAASATSVQVSNTSITPGQSVTLTAQVADATTGSTGTPTGAVNFYDNGVLLNTTPASLSGGVAVYATASLAPGITHAITATYSGDPNFTVSNSTSGASTTITVKALDFTMLLTGPTNLTVVPGQSITYQVQISPDYGSYAGTVNFAVSGLPPGATVAFSPASIPVSGGPQSVNVTIQTAAATSRLHPALPPSPGRRLEPIAFAFLVLFGAGTLRKRGRGLRRMLCVLVLLGTGITAVTLSGCGGHSGFLGQSPQNYTVTVTATAGSLQHSSTVTLNVQ